MVMLMVFTILTLLAAGIGLVGGRSAILVLLGKIVSLKKGKLFTGTTTFKSKLKEKKYKNTISGLVCSQLCPQCLAVKI